MKRKTIAQDTVAICEKGFYVCDSATIFLHDSIRHATENTRLFDFSLWPKCDVATGQVETSISVTEETTLAAIHRMGRKPGGHLACLNFASAKNPGGGFLGGAEAQEESLARSSTLYPALLTVPEHYERNRSNKSLLYLDLAVWSPSVAFFRNDHGELLPEFVEASVITAAAPNAGAIRSNEPESLDRIGPTLDRRAAFVLEIALRQGVKRIILGAWGCGVFRNDPEMVADSFSRLICKGGQFHNRFEEIVFAIYDRTAEKTVLEAFERVFQTKP